MKLIDFISRRRAPLSDFTRKKQYEEWDSSTTAEWLWNNELEVPRPNRHWLLSKEKGGGGGGIVICPWRFSPTKELKTRHLLGNLLHLMMTFHYFHCRDIIPAPVCDRSMCEERWQWRYDVVYVTLGRLWECDPSQTFLACIILKNRLLSAQSVSVSIESNWRREICIISIHSLLSWKLLGKINSMLVST